MAIFPVALTGRWAPRGAGWGWAFRRTEYVIVDLETTGWEPGAGRITEIGAVRVRRGRVSARFSSLVRCTDAIPAPVTELTGISDAMTERAPPLAPVLADFLAFARGGVLTAHNAPFDVAFLTAACQECGVAWPGFPVLDTLELAHRVLRPGEVPDCRLSTLASHFRARVAPCHRALPDALATADVLAALLRRVRYRALTRRRQPWSPRSC